MFINKEYHIKKKYIELRNVSCVLKLQVHWQFPDESLTINKWTIARYMLKLNIAVLIKNCFKKSLLRCNRILLLPTEGWQTLSMQLLFKDYAISSLLFCLIFKLWSCRESHGCWHGWWQWFLAWVLPICPIFGNDELIVHPWV